MNVAFNTAIKQSKQIRADLSSLISLPTDAPPPHTITPAALGSLSASITALGRTIDQYGSLARQELDPVKQEKAQERLKNFRAELAEYKSSLDGLKAAREDAIQTENRAELLGRRPYVTATPENPYAYPNAGGGGGGASMSLDGGGGYGLREGHALREQTFFRDTSSTLDQYIAQGQAVLNDLDTQREMLKSTQRKLYSVGNVLGLSGDTIRTIERRAREDKWIFAVGVVVFFGFCWLCLHYLR